MDNESNDDNNEDNNCNYQVIVISSIHRQCNSDTVQVVTSSVSSSDFDIFFYSVYYSLRDIVLLCWVSGSDRK